MKRIIAIILVINSIAVYAGVSRNIGISVRNTQGVKFDFSTSPYSNVTFYAYLSRGGTIYSDDKLYHNSPGSGYLNTATHSITKVDIGNFNTEWIAGDSIVFVIHQDLVKGGCGLTKKFEIPAGTSSIYYGVTTGYVFDGPWLLSPTPDPEPIQYTVIGTVDFNGNIFDFSPVTYDNVTFECWVSGKESKVWTQNSYKSAYYRYNGDASAIRIYDNYGWTIDDTLNVRIKQDFPGIGYYTGFKQFVYTFTHYTENYGMIGPYEILFGLDDLFEYGGGEPVKADVWTEYPTSRQIGFNVRKADGSFFDFSGENPDPDGKDGLTFYAYIKSRPTEKLYNSTDWCGYIYNTDATPGLSACMVNIGNFPTQWAEGDSIVFVAQHEVGKAANGLTKTFMIPGGFSSVYFGYTTGYVFDGPWRITDPSSLDNNVVPAETALYQNYPNPFNPVTQIRFALKITADVRLTVYNIAGQKVADLVKGTRLAGVHTIDFDGSRLNSGIYYYTLEADGKTMTKKMLMVK
jgi:hypothetical protein